MLFSLFSSSSTPIVSQHSQLSRTSIISRLFLGLWNSFSQKHLGLIHSSFPLVKMYKTATLLALFAPLCLSHPVEIPAAPVPANATTEAQAVAVPEAAVGSAVAPLAEVWTIQGARRVCNSNDSECVWTFTVSTNSVYAPVPCTVKISSDTERKVPASHNNAEGVICGPYRVSAGWSSVFGVDNGFTVLPVVDMERKMSVYPSYEDKKVEKGEVVVPDLRLPVKTWE
ncbi:hypothetical protein QBC41DRAFT_332074 [Cercophora samala]|uniref:Uncharacterized protein n=1 Tax=Cercophora samala TaxID=330535 RepID=A0AA40CY07_9PEZI|nr:hypothetical protein QBC41DRAFT_332074 [Cercophora samala]